MIKRNTARAVVLSEPGNEVLLLSYLFPGRDRTIWLTPGGGIEHCETPEEALRRELAEETGLAIDDGWEGPVWRRQHRFKYLDEIYEQHEEIYLLRVPKFTPTSHQNPAEVEKEYFQEFRWWSVAELRTSNEIFVPATIHEHLRSLIEFGPPPAPVEVGR